MCLVYKDYFFTSEMVVSDKVNSNYLEVFVI